MECVVKSRFVNGGRSHGGGVETNPTSIHEAVGLIPGLTQWVNDLALQWAVGVGCRRGSDLALLWLLCRLAAVALIWALAWKPPHAFGVGLKSQKQTNKQTNKKTWMGYKWTYVQNGNRLWKTYGFQRCEERDGLGIWDRHMLTEVYGMVGQWGPAI